ncbi:MAG TPA: type II toxin-antitoxin system PemK/MazF family toxin [Pirellulales bacterium]|nr:type II toxin-antitoxin system PemK/MazF family toxin [Pirellulales bacterium]
MPSKNFKQGAIVWAKLGPRGLYKKRPAVILTRDSELDATKSFFVAAGSCQVSSPLAANEVLLPSGGSLPHPLTRLKKPTVIVCDWIEEVTYSDVIQWGGETPPTALLEILSKLPNL